MIQCYVSVCSKSMWLSWISSSFKVHLCRGVFSPCNISNVSTWPVLFKEQGSLKVWSCLWKWIMSGTKEITEDLRKRVDVAHWARNVYKTISKEFGLHKSRVRQIVYKWRIQDLCYLPEKCSTNKDHSRAERVIVCEVTHVPRVTSKQLKAFLTLTNVNVHEAIIRRTQRNHDEHDRAARRKHCSPKRKIAWTSQRTTGERFNGWMKPK